MVNSYAPRKPRENKKPPIEKILYEAKYGLKDVEPLEVVKETAAQIQVWVHGRLRRQAKESSYSAVFETEEEAWDAIVAHAERKVKAAEFSLEYARKNLVEARAARAKGLGSEAEA